MAQQSVRTTDAPVVSPGRRPLRLVLAAAAAAVGVVYILIAAQVVHVAETAGRDSPFIPMAAAAAAFWLGAVLLVVFDSRVFYLLGAAVQVVVLAGYVAAASSRDPHVEAWGLGMKVVQVLLLAGLLYLAVKAPWKPLRARR